MYKRISSAYELHNQTRQHACFVLKHSNTCSISANAKKEFDSYFTKHTHDGNFYLVIVQEQKDVSNQIAEMFSVKHESPQVLVLKDDAVKFFLNHDAITKENIEKEVKRCLR